MTDGIVTWRDEWQRLSKQDRWLVKSVGPGGELPSDPLLRGLVSWRAQRRFRLYVAVAVFAALSVVEAVLDRPLDAVTVALRVALAVVCVTIAARYRKLAEISRPGA